MAVQYEATFMLGKMKLCVKSNSSKELIQEAGFFGSLPNQCPRCQSPVRLDHHENSGYNYYELRCSGNEEHRAKISEYADNSGFFFRHNQKWLTLEELKSGMKHYDDGAQNQGGQQRGNQNYQGQQNYNTQPPPQHQNQGGGQPQQSNPKQRPQQPPANIPDGGNMGFDDVDDDLPF